MAELEKKPVKIVETILRDAHQSQIATRMTTEQMLPIVDKLDKVGYHAVECWGGATFDASLRFLHEDPWERLRKLRDGFKNTKLQMLFRGQNILGYRPYADDVVEYFVQKSAANGIDIIRIFDCLNDLRNLQTAVSAANKEKAHAQVALSYTLGDAYTLEYWTDIAKRIEDMGANSICIKDMAGLLLPNKATELVTALKETVSIPIDLHTHYTSGVASMTYLKAVETKTDLWNNLPEQDHFLESMAEAAKAVTTHCGENILYISVMNRLSVDCDCDSNPEEPKMADIGMLASLDPVALDKACVDLVYASPDPGRVHLIERMESRHGIHIVEHAEALGMGSQRYDLVSLDDK